jgi:2-polyprenyl-6-methoxyphenol hydroxylase-like FAD-dependent oxidoreductase
VDRALGYLAINHRTARLVELALDGLGLHLLVMGDAAQIEAAWALLVDLPAAREEQQLKVIICGAGIAGLSLAWWLQRAGWNVLIVERAPHLRGAGYMIDFFGSGYDAAELMGLIPRLEQIQYPIPEIAYVDQTGRRVAGLDYALFQRLQNGRLLSFMRGDLERVLFEALPAAVEIRFNCTIDAVKQQAQHVEVLLSDGVRERADLLVGADGIHSRVRELVFGAEQQFVRYLGFHTAAYVFEDQALRRALQGSFALLSVPAREAGFYPIGGGKVASFFVHHAPQAQLPSSPCAELKRVYGDLGWIVPAVLEHCRDDTPIYYDQVAQIELPHWHRGRVTLVGDACQAVSLLAGQGASMAMGGAYVLARELGGDGPIEERLAHYEARVKPAIERKQLVGRRTANWIAPASHWRIAARNMALRLAGLPGLSWLLRPVLTSGSESVVERADAGS